MRVSCLKFLELLLGLLGSILGKLMFELKFHRPAFL